MRRIKYYLTFIHAVILHIVIAQPGFNIIVETAHPQNHFLDMLVDNDTIVGYGVAFSDTVEWKQGLLLAKMDSSGALVKTNFILDSLGDVLTLDKFYGKIITTADGGYAMTAAAYFRNSAFLIKVNRDLEVEFIKEYPDTINLSNYVYRLAEIEGGFLLYGSIQRPNFLDQGFIRRVDHYGTTVWFEYYGNPNTSNGIMDIKVLNDSTFIAGSVENTTSSVFSSSRTIFRILDMQGNELQYWASNPDPDIGYLRKVFPLDDGGYLTYGVYVVEYLSPTYKVVQSAVARLDADFQVTQVHHYGLKGSLAASIRLWDVEQLPDGNFIGAGQSGIKIPGEPGKSAGWLMKFSPQGDSIWSRYDRAPFQDDIGTGHYYGGAGVLSSGNIIAGGGVENGAIQFIWLVKVTTDGCLDTLFCGLVDVGEVVPVPAAEVKVYPNPASGVIHLDADGSTLSEVRLLDLIGREVYSWKNGNGLRGTVALQIPEHIAAGVYFLSIETSGHRRAHKKLIIRR